MKIYIGNLPFSITADEVQELFEEFGTVVDVNLITDRDTGRPRGFGFVEMTEAEDAREAIHSLNQANVGGRNIVVNEARPRNNNRSTRRW